MPPVLIGAVSTVAGALAPLASIPSPSRESIGPFSFYGMIIACGVMAAVALAAKRMRTGVRGGTFALVALVSPAA